MRSLSAEEADLWAKVTASIRPLSRQEISKPDSQDTEKEAENQTAEAPPVRPRGRRPAERKPPPAPRPAPSPGTLDGSWDRKLRLGSVVPDRTLDLHGHSLDRAWAAIDRALEDAVRAGDRLVLLITGHERPGEPPVARGRIRAAVHDWLAVSRHAAKIAAVRGAHPRHGGGGSLYIILRRG